MPNKITNSSVLHFLSNNQRKFSQFIDQLRYLNTRYLYSIMSPCMTSVNHFSTDPQVGKWAITSSTPGGKRDKGYAPTEARVGTLTISYCSGYLLQRSAIK